MCNYPFCYLENGTHKALWVGSMGILFNFGDSRNYNYQSAKWLNSVTAKGKQSLMRYLNGLNKMNRRLNQRAEYFGIQEDFFRILNCKGQEYFFEKLIIGDISFGGVFSLQILGSFCNQRTVDLQWMSYGERDMFTLLHMLSTFLPCFQFFPQPFFPLPTFFSCYLSGKEDLLISLFRTKCSQHGRSHPWQRS